MALLIATALWLGGETTSALSYLFCERTIRPGTALALQARAPTRPTLGVRSRLVIAWSLGTAVPMLSILGVGIAGLVNALPAESVRLFELGRAGRFEEAAALYHWFLPLLRLDTVPKFGSR